MLIVNRVQEYRKQRKLTQEELAAKVGVSRKTIVSLEKGNYTPSLLLAFLLAKELDTAITVLFAVSEENT